MSHRQLVPKIIYKQLKPRVVTAVESPHPGMVMPMVIHETFAVPLRGDIDQVLMKSLDAFLTRIGFSVDWIDQFLLAAAEPIHNAVEHGPPGSFIRGLIFVIENDHGRFCSMFIDNDLSPGQAVSLSADDRADLETRLSDTCGRGYDIMAKLLDGLAVTYEPGRFFQAILEKDECLTDLSDCPPLRSQAM